MDPFQRIFIFLILFAQYGHGQLQITKIDSIINDGIQQYAFPGATLLVSHKDSIIFYKTYGFHTYDSIVKVSKTDLYDLASVTKILGPLPALMKLVEEGKLDLDQPFSNYWRPWQKHKEKQDITLRQILAHQAGLQPYIVFLNQVKKKNSSLKKRFIRKNPSKRFQKQAYDGLYVRNRFERKVFRHINRSKVSTDKKYKYSGLTFLIFPKLIQLLTGKDYEAYLAEQFYDPIGALTLGFNPIKNGIINPTVPTENDTLFRYTLTKGWVHDENAALLGGVSGNAGLFGTAIDVHKMMQLYQNFGVFEGKRLLKKETVQEFINIQYPENQNRRGLGFDKPLLGNDTLDLKDAYPAPRASTQSFGHAGFTGTFVWADPKHELTFIFLSNRVYPTRDNRGLYSLNIRPKLHQMFYNTIIH
ncbi:MAG: serine hydrolase [Bacteroidota bacterium]